MTRRASPREQVLARLEDLASAGVDGLPRAGRPAERATGASGGGEESWRSLDLRGLGSFLSDCTRCKLCKGRTQVVFGVGDPRARLMFVGEGPGRDEDLKGEPFVGRAGQLLTEMIERGMGLSRSAVYIANVVKCRPPENREPEPDEVAACRPFLLRQVELVKPEVIVTLGRVATQALLETTVRIGVLRGTWQDLGGIPVLPTFHPAYLLRNPQDKRLAWEDLKLVMGRLGLRPPSR